MSRTRKHALTGAKRYSHQCRNHGECEWCRGNRTYNELRDKEKAEYDEKEFRNNEVMMGDVFSEILCAQVCDRSEKCIRRILLDGYLWHKEQGEKLSPLCKMYMGDTKDCKYYIELDEWANQ